MTVPVTLCTIFEAYLIKSPRLYQDAVLAVFGDFIYFFDPVLSYIFIFAA